MHTSRIALVSGANRGLGLETSHQLARRGIIVLMGARDMEKGHQATKALKKQGFLTRDARKKERKKAGQPGARKKFQYSKR